MYESDDIIQYLFKTYGDGEVPVFLRLGALTSLTAGLSQLPRGSKGSSARPSKIPEKPLILWGYEGSPFVKIVREELCELEIPYLLKTCARGSQTRDEMLQRFDHFQVPCLEVTTGRLHHAPLPVPHLLALGVVNSKIFTPESPTRIVGPSNRNSYHCE